MPLVTKKRSLDLMATLVRETSVIDGFSYPFLHILVKEARVLEKKGQLVMKDGPTGWGTCTHFGGVVLSHIADQLKGGWDDTAWSSKSDIELERVGRLLAAAEDFINIFDQS